MASKTKWGASLIGLSLILGSVMSFKQGNIGLVELMRQVAEYLGGVALVWGFRDLPIVNSSIFERRSK
jgi:hypothetical protein